MAAVDSCESACARYETCGKTAEVFGDLDGCLNTCERLTRAGDEPVEGWWNRVGKLQSFAFMPRARQALSPSVVMKSVNLLKGVKLNWSSAIAKRLARARVNPFKIVLTISTVGSAAGFETCPTRDVF